MNKVFWDRSRQRSAHCSWLVLIRPSDVSRTPYIYNWLLLPVSQSHTGAAPPVGVWGYTFAACTRRGVQRNSHSTSALENSASCTVCYNNDTENLTYRLKSMSNFAQWSEALEVVNPVDMCAMPSAPQWHCPVPCPQAYFGQAWRWNDGIYFEDG